MDADGGVLTQHMRKDEGPNLAATVGGLLKDPLIANILSILKKDLSKKLAFHSWEHTEDVLRETINFALEDKIDDRSILLLGVAAAYHDSGFLITDQNNEEIGAQYAKEAMMASGRFTLSEIHTVERMVIDTKLCEVTNHGVHNVSTDLSRYLLDGDLSNLGRDDFFERAKLRLMEVGIEPKLFYEATLSLIKSHRWQTKPAERLRQSKKMQNIKQLEQFLQTL